MPINYPSPLQGLTQGLQRGYQMAAQRAEKKVNEKMIALQYYTKLLNSSQPEEVKKDIWNNNIIPILTELDPNAKNLKHTMVWSKELDASSKGMLGIIESYMKGDTQPDDVKRGLYGHATSQAILSGKDPIKGIDRIVKHTEELKTQKATKAAVSRLPEGQQQTGQDIAAGVPKGITDLSSAGKTPTTLKGFVEQNALASLQAGDIDLNTAADRVKNIESLLKKDMSETEVKKALKNLAIEMTRLGQNQMGEILAQITGTDTGEASPDAIEKAKLAADIYRGELINKLPIDQRGRYVIGRSSTSLNSIEDFFK